MNKIKNYLLLLLTVICILLAWRNRYLINKNQEYKIITDNYSAVLDTLKMVKYKDSSKSYTIESLTGNNKELKLLLKVRDSSIIDLVALVSKYKGKINSAAIISSNTNIDNKSKTNIDTNQFTQPNVVFPVYKSEVHLGKWVQAIITASPDSTELNETIHEEYKLTIGVENKKTYGDIITLNPYDEIKSFRVYDVQLPKQKVRQWQLGFGGGAGATVVPSNGNVYLGLQLGIYLTRRIL
jgi:hypothetical protein